MKKNKVSKSDAIESSDESAVCGIMDNSDVDAPNGK